MTLATFIPIFVFFVFVMIIVIVSQSIKSEKKKKEEESRRAQNTRTRLDEEDVFAQVTGDKNVPAKSGPHGGKTAGRERVKVEGTGLYEAAPRVRTSAKVVGISRSHHDEHCDVDHSDDDLYIVEKVPVSGSIDGKSDEGCGEHYGLRFVKIDASDGGSGKIEVSPDDVRKAIILGEVINDPAYKKY